MLNKNVRNALAAVLAVVALGGCSKGPKSASEVWQSYCDGNYDDYRMTGTIHMDMDGDDSEFMANGKLEMSVNAEVGKNATHIAGSYDYILTDEEKAEYEKDSEESLVDMSGGKMSLASIDAYIMPKEHKMSATMDMFGFGGDDYVATDFGDTSEIAKSYIDVVTDLFKDADMRRSGDNYVVSVSLQDFVNRLSSESDITDATDDVEDLIGSDVSNLGDVTLDFVFDKDCKLVSMTSSEFVTKEGERSVKGRLEFSFIDYGKVGNVDVPQAARDAKIDDDMTSDEGLDDIVDVSDDYEDSLQDLDEGLDEFTDAFDAFEDSVTDDAL